jgi:hypothetical protein
MAVGSSGTTMTAPAESSSGSLFRSPDLDPTSLRTSATGLCSLPEYVALTTAARTLDVGPARLMSLILNVDERLTMTIT